MFAWFARMRRGRDGWPEERRLPRRRWLSCALLVAARAAQGVGGEATDA
jgi:hypothetical protein